MRNTFITAGTCALIAAVLSTALALYAQNEVGKKALQQHVVDRAADWQKFITVYAEALELQRQANTSNELSLETLKDMLAAQKIGRSGYFIARTSDGVYEVSKDRVRDGENIWDTQDADGNFIVREHTQTALDNPQGGTFSEYYWQNNDDPKPRKKVGSYAYVESLDWVIAATAYYDDKPAFLPNALKLFLISLVGFGILFFGFAFLTRRTRNVSTYNV